MIGLIVNPNSRKNRHKPSRVRRFEKVLGRHGTVIETPSVDSIVPALERFAKEGRRYWVADGGDGALHWMINEAVRYFGPQRAASLAVYVPSNAGTIDFVAKAIGLEGSSLEIVARLAAAVAEGRTPSVVEVPVVSFNGLQTQYGDEAAPWRRVGFGCALAGFGANFFGPLYRGNKEYGGARIAKLLAAAFGAGLARSTLRGVLSPLKPDFVTRAEHEFLRPLRGEVKLDGVVLRGEDGRPVREHTVLHAGSVLVNLAGIFRVFPSAGEGKMHVHAGHVSVLEAARVLPGLMTGRSVSHLLRDAYDGAASTLDVVCDPGEELAPVLDGEVFHRITELHASVGPHFTMALP
jgi:hypothetical protein